MNRNYSSVPSLLENRSLDMEELTSLVNKSNVVKKSAENIESGLATTIAPKNVEIENNSGEISLNSSTDSMEEEKKYSLSESHLDKPKSEKRPTSASLATVMPSHRTEPIKGPEYDPFSDDEYIFAARLLESFLGHAESITDGKRRSGVNLFDTRLVKNRRLMENRHRICTLAYDTLKFVKLIDSILIKTQFLVVNQDLIEHLSLVKVLLYDVMKHEFNYSTENGIKYISGGNDDSMVKVVSERIKGFSTKLGAAYARMRIEKQADGESPLQVLNNILPQELREKESLAEKMKKFARINTCKTNINSIVEYLIQMEIPVSNSADDSETCVTLDKDFEFMLSIPSKLFPKISQSDLIRKGLVSIQDKVSMIAPLQLASLVDENEEPVIMEASANNGTGVATIASLLNGRGKIFAVEDRRSRLKEMKKRFKKYDVPNVEIVPTNFLDIDPNDPYFEDVSYILVEPPSSGNAIADQFGYIMQEEELPQGDANPDDIPRFQSKQLQMLEHALKFPNLKNIIYVTRSTNFEENEEVVCDILDHYSVELDFVLPQFSNDQCDDDEFIECMKLEPTDFGNGVFVACFNVHSFEEEEDDIDADAEVDEEAIGASSTSQIGKEKNKASSRKKRQRKRFEDEPDNLKSINNSKPSLTRNGGKKSSMSKSDSLESPQRRLGSVGFHEDLTIFGVNLRKLVTKTADGINYEPVRKSMDKLISWKYPVPNPQPWK